MDKLLEILKSRPYIVIGSGPTAAAVCSQIIKSGSKPVVLDVGYTSSDSKLDPKIDCELEVIDLAQAQRNKKWLGSLSSYRQSDHSNLVRTKELNVCQSFGFGGFSTVWGGTFDFFSDFTMWPEETIPSRIDIDNVSKLVPTTANVNASGNDFSFRAYDFSISYYKRIMNLSKVFGNLSKLAIETDPMKVNNCKNLGTCITGCTEKSIWSSADTFQEWSHAGLIDYFPNVFLEKIESGLEGERVIVRKFNETIRLVNFKRVFICCGPIGTATAIIRSGIYQEIRVRDTSTAFFGALSLRQKPLGTRHHSLSQFWVQLDEPRLRAQFYSPDFSSIEQILLRYPKLKVFTPLLKKIALRIHPFISYLDTNLSASLILRASEGEVELSSENADSTHRYHKKSVRKLSRKLHRAGLFIPIFLFRLPPPGGGFHIGNSLPHGSETDYLGRLESFRKIHIADSSVLPSLEVGSITPTAMANAFRIARVSIQEDTLETLESGYL